MKKSSSYVVIDGQEVPYNPITQQVGDRRGPTESFLQVFAPHGERLSDDAILDVGVVIDRSGCEGRPFKLSVRGREVELPEGCSPTIREVSAGERLHFVAQSGRRRELTFNKSGVLLLLPLPTAELRSLARACVRHAAGSLGVSLGVRTLAVHQRGGLSHITDSEFFSIDLTDGADQDRGVTVDLVEV